MSRGDDERIREVSGLDGLGRFAEPCRAQRATTERPTNRCSDARGDRLAWIDGVRLKRGMVIDRVCMPDL